MQSDPFGSTPNWHIAHVTWFFQKILEKYRQDIDANSINTDYLNSYYSHLSWNDYPGYWSLGSVIH